MLTFADSLTITKPTMIVDKSKAIKNIRWMKNKADNSGVRLRPHFKTHQSAEIGEWFREEGIKEITVSSTDMALYFAQHGWKDITIAFPANVHEIDHLNTLAETIKLNLVVDSLETALVLGRKLKAGVNIWLKIDIGYHRAGIFYTEMKKIADLSQEILNLEKLNLKGILTHAGHAYQESTHEGRVRVYDESVERMRAVHALLAEKLGLNLEISVGDTPCTSAITDFEAVDEIRPGNFVFFDIMQLERGVCTEDQVAMALACPVVAKYSARNEILIHGGAVHFSKEKVTGADGSAHYGAVAFPWQHEWGKILKGIELRSLSQDHGLIRAAPEHFSKIAIGDILIVFPVHSCLTANLMGEFRTLEGGHHEMMTKHAHR